MSYLKKTSPVLIFASALIFAPSLAQAKNSPTFPQYQQNGGTAAAPEKDGGGGGVDIFRDKENVVRDPGQSSLDGRDHSPIVNQMTLHTQPTISNGFFSYLLVEVNSYILLIEMQKEWKSLLTVNKRNQ